MVWVTLLLVAGGLALVRARDVQQRVIALDLLAVLVVALLALLSYLLGRGLLPRRGGGAVAAVVRRHGGGGAVPRLRRTVRMISVVLDVVGAVLLLILGLTLMTIGLVRRAAACRTPTASCTPRAWPPGPG